MWTWVRWMAAVWLVNAGLHVQAQDAPAPADTTAVPSLAQSALNALAKDTTTADSLRHFTEAVELCVRAAEQNAPPDAAGLVVRDGLRTWYARMDSMPDEAAWRFLHAVGELRLVDGEPAEALQAFNGAQRRLPGEAGAEERALRDLNGRAQAFAQLHRYDSAYATSLKAREVEARIHGIRQEGALDSLRQVLHGEVAAVTDTLNVVRKQALLDQRHAARRTEWMTYALIGAALLAVLFLVLYLVRGKQAPRVVTVQAPPVERPAPAPPPTPPAAPPPAVAPGSGARVSAGIFSAEEFAGDLERLTGMIREGRQVDALGWAQAMGKLGRTMLDRADESTVADELAVLRHYLKVEAMRAAGTHFEVTADRAVTDAGTRIPSLSVLPFVQAAMRLGAGRAEGERLLIVHFQADEQGTACIISSNGPAWAAQAEDQRSTANAVLDLRVARERFAQHGTCTISDLPEAGGTRILLRFRR